MGVGAIAGTGIYTLTGIGAGPAGPAGPACRQFSWAYVVKAGETVASMLLTRHNLTFYQDLTMGLRSAIADGRLAGFAADFRTHYGPWEEAADSLK